MQRTHRRTGGSTRASWRGRRALALVSASVQAVLAVATAAQADIVSNTIVAGGSPSVVAGDTTTIGYTITNQNNRDGDVQNRILLTEDQIHELAETHELDCAIGVRQLGRFRLNVAFQRGTPTVTIRAIPVSIKSIPAQDWFVSRTISEIDRLVGSSLSSPAR